MKQALIDRCHQQLQQFCCTIDALDFQFQETKKQAQWQIFTSASQVEVVYEKKGTLLHAPSLLYARIYPLKGEALFLHPHEMRCIAGLPLGCSDFYPYIESPERMTACTKALTDSVQVLLPLAQAWAEDPDLYEVAQRAKILDISRVSDLKDGDLPPENVPWADAFYRNLFQLWEQRVILPRFTAAEGPYLCLANGHEKKARKLYAKWASQQKLTNYEAVLWQQLQTGSGSCTPSPTQCNTLAQIAPYATSNAEGLRLLANLLLLWPAFTVVFMGISHVIISILSAGSLFYGGMDWYFPLVLAGLPALFGTIALRRWTIPLLYPKAKAKILAADKLINGKGLDILATTTLLIALVFSLVFSVLLPFEAVIFHQEHFTYPPINSSFPTPQRLEASYEEVTAIYRIDGIYNDYGDFIDRPSYVLELADGSLLRLDGYVSMEDTQAHILPLVTPYGGEPVHLESDRDLPQ